MGKPTKKRKLERHVPQPRGIQLILIPIIQRNVKYDWLRGATMGHPLAREHYIYLQQSAGMSG